jgi:NADH:ubiquinone oxidoreductase subunit 6 (subunit J)
MINVNVAQILQGMQSDTRAGLLIVGVFLLCIVMLYYVWVNERERSEEPDEDWENIEGAPNSDGM